MNKEITQLLEKEFEQRKLKNSNYSLRAYARYLEISPAYLSQIFNNKMKISKAKAMHLISKVLTGTRLKEWINLIEKSDDRFFHKGYIPTYKKIHCNITLTWAHYAVIESFNLADFKSDIKWIDEQLGIGLERTKEIINELLSIGAIKEENSVLVSNEVSLTNINDKNTSDDRKQMQRDILARSLEAINTVDISKRNHTSMTIAINSKNLEKMITRIQAFRRELCSEATLDASNQADEIYQLQTSFFPLARPLA
jgi:uncharacterized protein (TIGR02147 family)